MKRVLLDINEVIDRYKKALDEELDKSNWQMTPRVLAISAELDKLNIACERQGYQTSRRLGN